MFCGLSAVVRAQTARLRKFCVYTCRKFTKQAHFMSAALVADLYFSAPRLMGRTIFSEYFATNKASSLLESARGKRKEIFEALQTAFTSPEKPSYLEDALPTNVCQPDGKDPRSKAIKSAMRRGLTTV
jgi:hypothetical protein